MSNNTMKTEYEGMTFEKFVSLMKTLEELKKTNGELKKSLSYYEESESEEEEEEEEVEEEVEDKEIIKQMNKRFLVPQFYLKEHFKWNFHGICLNENFNFKDFQDYIKNSEVVKEFDEIIENHLDMYVEYKEEEEEKEVRKREEEEEESEEEEEESFYKEVSATCIECNCEGKCLTPPDEINEKGEFIGEWICTDCSSCFREEEEEEEEDYKITMVKNMIGVWKECMINFNPQYTTYHTLTKVKEFCDRFDLNSYIVKDIFDSVEDPYYYDIENDDIRSNEEESEEE